MKRAFSALLLAGFGLFANSALAAPANDNFASAELLSTALLHGSATNDLTSATVEPGEPSHAGYAGLPSVWYKFVAPQNGEVTLQTFGSADATALCVYTGTNVSTLIQLAANDGANNGASSAFANIYDSSFGPAIIRFNAAAGATYYIAVAGNPAPVVLNWAYNPAGVFRFASALVNRDGNPVYLCAETESFPPQDPSASEHNQPGLLVTVTRVGGATGRILVDYETVDGNAIGDLDYGMMTGTLEFRDFEMSKTILIPIYPSFPGVIDNEDDGMVRVFGVMLSNPRLADGESDEVSVPQIDPVKGLAVVGIFDTDVDPVAERNYDTNDPPVFAGPTNVVANFEKMHYQFAEDVTNRWVDCVIYVVRSFSRDGNPAFTLNYQGVIGSPLYWSDNQGANTYDLSPGSDYATPDPETTGGVIGLGPDFSPITGSVAFGQDDFDPKPITFRIYEDQRAEFNEDIRIRAWEFVNGAPVARGQVYQTTVTILWNDRNPPAGSVDQFHNADYGSDMIPPVLTVPPSMKAPGADGLVFDLLVQSDDKTVVVGDFQSFNTVPRLRIARMNIDGSLDDSFNPGAGANNFISSIRMLPSGQFVIGGAFTFYNGSQRNSIARINSDGSLDSSFDPGTGANGTVWAVAVQTDGKVIIAGDFTTFNGLPRNRIARLNTDGSLDTSFDPAFNPPNGTINAVVLNAANQIIIGGEFSALGAFPIHNIARLNSSGTIDNGFRNNLGLGFDGPVFALNLQPDGRLLVGGEFFNFNVTPRTRIARLNGNGTLDTSFEPGSGANDTVYSINYATSSLGTNGGFVTGIYVGGLFSSYNGTRRAGFARLFVDGTVDTSFLDTAYNQFAGLTRSFYNPAVSPKPFVWASAVQSDGNVMIGGGFDQVGGGQRDPRIQTEDFAGGAFDYLSRAGYRNRNNVARLIGGQTPGPGNISLWYSDYTVNRQQGSLDVALMRTNGALGFLSANFALQPSLAQSGVDYIYTGIAPAYLTSWNSSRMISDGLFGTNNVLYDIYGREWPYEFNTRVTVTIPNPKVSGNRFSTFTLANPSGADFFYLGGENIAVGGALGRSRSSFTIVDDNKQPGALGFELSSYSVSEGTNATVTITRTNGSYGSASIQFATSNGTAVAGIDYYATNGTLNFAAGQTNKSFVVRILNNGVIQPVDRTINLRVFNPSSAGLGLSNAVLSVVDDDYEPGFLNFSSATYATNEGAGAIVVTVTRTGGNKGTMTVQCGTTNGTALNGINYVGLTNTLVWNDGDSSPRHVTVQLVDNNLVNGNTAFSLRLFNATVNTAAAPTALAGALTRTTVTIIEDEAYGGVEFSAPSYSVNENGGYASVTVVRKSGSAETVRVNYSTAPGSAVSSGVLPNFVAASGTLVFGPGEVAKSFDVQLLTDGLQNPSPFFFTVQLGAPNPASILGSITNAVINIVDAESFNRPSGSGDPTFDPTPGFNSDVLSIALQSDGRILAAGAFTRVNSYDRNRIARVNADATLDTSFGAGLSGANSAIRTMLLQSDGRILIGGDFSLVNSVARNRLARLVEDGNLDSSFDPGSGADGAIYALAETFTPDRTVLIGGGFTTVNGVPRAGLARLRNDGSLDPAFNPALSVNGTVYAIAVYPTNTIQAGKILISGDFTSVNGITRNRIARLTPDGSIDLTFDPGEGADSPILALLLQRDGRLIAGGSFTNFNGVLVNRIARINLDGSVDGSFQTSGGANDTVTALALQPDNRILVAGQFTAANGITRRRLTRLLTDGSPDGAVNFGTGANAFVSSVALQPDGMILIGGGFTEFDGQPRQRLARVYGGSISGAGSLEFTAFEYTVDEGATNALVTLRRRGGTLGTVSATVQTSAGTAVPGVNYSNVTASLVFTPGETFQSFLVPVLVDRMISPDLTVNLALTSITPPAVLGNQPVATLIIANTDSTVTFSSPTYRVNENLAGGVANIQVLRSGSTRGVASVDFLTTTNGTAIAGTNYIGITNTIVFLPGRSNITVQVPILHNPIAEGDKTVELILSNAVNTVVTDPAVALLTIRDVEQAPGQFFFGATNYVVIEGQPFLPVTVFRTNGSSGIVSLSFATVPGTAIPNVKYFPTNGTLTFADGELSKSFAVPIIDDNIVGGSVQFALRIFNPVGGATILNPNTVPATILDNDLGITFSSAAYVVSEDESSVILTVLRTNGTAGVTTVNFATTNITAMAGTNYTAASGTLTFSNGEAIKTFVIPILKDPRVTGNLSFGVLLSGATAPAQLLDPSTTVVNITDSDPGITFASTNYFVYTNSAGLEVTNAAFAALKSGTNVLITVLRSNANTGVISVSYATTNRTATAGVDYVATSGTLWFSNGISLQSFTVPIINNRLVQGDRTFDINLFNLTPGAQIVPPGTATVTIADDISGLAFSSPSYSIPENGGLATITVFRSNYTNSTVIVNYATANGSAVAGVNYVPVTGSLTFTNGETVKSFTVPVIDNTVVDGDHTVLLSLSQVIGNALLIDPSAATLNVLEADGSLIMAAGSAIQAESGPVNGVIDPGETVTMLLSLRNASGTNTVNLTGTLLASPGVTSPSGPQNYGVLAVRGPSVFRPFTFTANGTNGQPLTLNLALSDNGRQLSNVVYSLSIGNIPTLWSNSSPIVINDFTNATPYPAIINVSGVAGTVNRATVTISNLNHTWPRDINMILVSPGGQKSYLMSKAGGSVAANNVTITFDDNAAASLPFSGQLLSGSFKPSAFSAAPPPFPVPAPPPPYATNMSVFNGSNPNGTWALYVFDDKGWDYGAISNGWTLRLNTGAPAASDVGLAMSAAPQTVVASSNVAFTVTVANYGPGSASNIVVSDVLPAAYVGSAVTQGSAVTNGNGTLSWSIGSLGTNASASLTVTVRPQVPGIITNVATVVSSTTDLNLDNNTASATANVVVPTADLVLALSGAPNPIATGATVTYSITVTNLGPATAPGLSIVDTLPVGFTFVSANPAASVSGQTVTFNNLGDLSSGAFRVVTVVARATVGGTFNNSASCSAAITDPLKGNNAASVKTDVEPLQLAAARSGNDLIFSWPADANAALQSTPGLSSSAVWSAVTNAPVESNGRITVVVPIGPGNLFFRLSVSNQ